jgi:hypothetical protein
VGVPEIVPLALKERPDGSEPEITNQRYGALPPDAESVAEYVFPTVPFGKLKMEMLTSEVELFGPFAFEVENPEQPEPTTPTAATRKVKAVCIRKRRSRRIKTADSV